MQARGAWVSSKIEAWVGWVTGCVWRDMIWAASGECACGWGGSARQAYTVVASSKIEKLGWYCIHMIADQKGAALQAGGVLGFKQDRRLGGVGEGVWVGGAGGCRGSPRW